MMTTTRLSAVVSLPIVVSLIIPPASSYQCNNEVKARYTDVLEARLELLETKQKTLELKNRELEDEFTSLHTKNYDLETQVNELKNKNIALDARLKSLKERSKVVEDQMGSMGINMTVLNTAVDSLTQHAERQQGLMQSLDISFQARSTEPRINLPASGSTLVLNQAVTNQGNGYNTTTGVFTAPLNGTYFFLATAWDYWAAHSSTLSLVVDGHQIGSGETSKELFYQLAMVQAVVVLQAGQKVWLKNMKGGEYYAGQISAFSGFLIRPSPCPN